MNKTSDESNHLLFLPVFLTPELYNTLKMLLKRLLFGAFLLPAFALLAQDAIPTKGTDFWIGFMQNYEVEPFQEELNIFITSDQSTVGTVEIPGQGFSQPFTVVANQTTTVTLDNPIAEHFTNQEVEQKGIFVQTADTVSVFAINFNGFTADGTKILPIQSLGVEYRISSYQGLSSWGSEFLIVATEDDSEIEITPSAATLGGDAAGVPFIVELDRGESYQVKVAQSADDFMGTVIKGTEANGECRPFAVFSGSGCTNIPTNCFACDHIYEQNFPVETWGTDYYVVPWEFATQYTYRILANEDNTTVTIDGGAPFVLNAGEYNEYNSVNQVRCVSADKGISVTQYMEGTTCAGTGDPAMCILNDETQKIDNITFSTVESNVITEHGLNIIMNTADVGTLTLDGVLVDSNEFTPFPSCTSHSYAQIAIPEGSHTLDAPNGFTAYVYGTGNAESYAYSVGSFTPAPVIEVDDVLCTSDEVTLAAEPGLQNVYWYTESAPEDTVGTGPVLVLTPPIISDIYVAAGEQFQSGCVQESLFSVEAPDPPTLVMDDESVEVCQYQEAQLGVTAFPAGTYTYTWSPAVGLDNPNIANPVVTPIETTWYTVLVSTLTGCGSNIDSVLVEVTNGNITTFEASADILEFCTGEQSQFNIDIQENVFEDNFDPGVSWGLWSNVLNGSESDGCGSAAGNALWFNGDGQRSAETIDVDVSQGGTVQFAIQIGAAAFPCDNVDLGEDIVLEYSTTGGAPWTIMETFFESGYAVFEDVSVPIPAGAQTASTRFRWRQLANSGNNQDNWAIDNVYIGATNTSNYDFTWSPNYELSALDIIDPIATPLLDTTYYVSMTDLLTGCEYIDSLTVDVGQGFDLIMSPDTVLCDIQGIDISATPDIDGDYDWLWDGDDINNPFIQEPTVSPNATTTYTVEVTSSQGCSSEGEVTVTVNQLLDLSVTTDNNDFCAGEIANLTADVGGVGLDLSYEWTPAVSLDDPNSATPVASPDEDTLYEVIVTDNQSGCILSDDIAIEVFDAFTVDAGEDVSLCETNGFQLNATADTQDLLTWSWDNPQALDNPGIFNPTLTADGTFEFTVSATSNAGCTSTDQVTVTLLVESFDLGPDIDICIGESTTLETGYGADFDHTWSTTEQTPTIEVNTTGTYSVTVVSPEGCEDTDNIDVTVHDLPVVDIGEDPDLCDGDTWTLDAGNPGMDYEWSTDQTSQTILVDETGTYSVDVTDQFGCVGTDNVELIFHLNPVINLPEEHTMCEDEFLLLDAENPGAQFAWNTNETSQTITVNEEGIYTVTVTNEFNCSTDDMTQLFIATYPVVELGPDASYCEGDVVTLDSQNPTLNNVWSNDSITSTIEVTESGIYAVTVDNDYCFTSDDIQLTFNPLPFNTLTPDTTTCFLDPPYEVVLNAGNNGATYAWSTGSTSQEIAADGPGIYAVEVTTPFGCSLVFSTIIEEFCVGDFLYLPNSFTPDQDGINDVFRAVGTSVADFEMTIWNRWGDIVYETNEFDSFWDGSYRGGDYYVESETYIYVVKYRFIKETDGSLSEWVEEKGHVTVIR